LSRQYPSQPLIGVGVVVWRDDKVLLIRRRKPPRQGEWSLPGGLQKLGETVFEAARREVMEETGVAIRVLDLTDVVDLIERDGVDGPVRYHYTLIDVAAEWLRGEAAPATDAAEVAWAELETLPRYRLWSETERVIRSAHRIWRESGRPRDKDTPGRN
jgi:ADP-ribose pyrophosphatase YjhB (NUDIX family)